MDRQERLDYLYGLGREARQSLYDQYKKARPIHPETGKEGRFLEFRQIHPIYVTEDGIEFTPSDEIQRDS